MLSLIRQLRHISFKLAQKYPIAFKKIFLTEFRRFVDTFRGKLFDVRPTGWSQKKLTKLIFHIFLVPFTRHRSLKGKKYSLLVDKYFFSFFDFHCFRCQTIVERQKFVEICINLQSIRFNFTIWHNEVYWMIELN